MATANRFSPLIRPVISSTRPLLRPRCQWSAAAKPAHTLRFISTSFPEPTRARSPGLKRITLEVDHKHVAYDHVYLRDACSCPKCVHPSTQQKLFRTVDIPLTIQPKSVDALEDGSVRIVWDSDVPGAAEYHESVYSAEQLQTFSSLRNMIRKQYNDQRQVLWDKRMMEKEVKWIQYDTYMTSDEALLEALQQLSLYGLVFIRGIPDDSNLVESIAERIGNLKDTFYGRTWDVKSVKESKNIAYTSLDLGLHMDLLYFESPPGLQFLHCVRNSTTGGSSIFADSFRAATVIRNNSRLLFDSLCRFPVTFHYRNDGKHYHYSRPTVVLSQNVYQKQARINHVNWAPPFQAPFEVESGGEDGRIHWRQYLHASRQLADEIDKPESQYELTLAEGECVIFFNRRVLHARRAFDPNSGDRWLKGAYVDIDAFQSKYRVLSAKYKQEDDYSYIKRR